MNDDYVAGPPPKRGGLQADGIRLSYLEWGTIGPCCLLLHGVTSNAQTWWRLGPDLVKAGFHAVALDMPGHGESGDVPDHRITAIAHLVAEAIRTLGLNNVTLVGHSWGGAVALALATSGDAAILDRIALMDPALAMSTDFGAMQVSIFNKGLGAPIEEASVALRAANPDWREQDIRWKAEAMLQCRASALTGFFTQSGDWNLVPSLAQVKVPLLLLAADPAKTIIGEAERDAAELALQAGPNRMIIVPGTTHNMYRGAGYEPTIAALMRWLGKENASAL